MRSGRGTVAAYVAVPAAWVAVRSSCASSFAEAPMRTHAVEAHISTLHVRVKLTSPMFTTSHSLAAHVCAVVIRGKKIVRKKRNLNVV